MKIKILLLIIYNKNFTIDDNNINQLESHQLNNYTNNTNESSINSITEKIKINKKQNNNNIFYICNIKFHEKNEMLIKTLVINFIVYVNYIVCFFISEALHFVIGKKYFYCGCIHTENNTIILCLLIHILFFLFINGLIIFIIKLKFKSFDWKKYLFETNIFIILNYFCHNFFNYFISYKNIFHKYQKKDYVYKDNKYTITKDAFWQRNWDRNDILSIIIFILYIIIINIILTINILNYKEYKNNIFTLLKKCWNKKTIRLKKNNKKDYIFLSVYIILFLLLMSCICVFLTIKWTCIYKDSDNLIIRII